MTFVVSEAEDNQIQDGTILEWAGPKGAFTIGTYTAVHNKDNVQTMVIDKMGHLMTGDGKRLNDLVADITVGEQRFGMIYCGVGQLGPRWRVNGPAYDEPLAA